MSTDFPHDATGDALRRLRADGVDLSKPHRIDFWLAAPDEASGREVMRVAAERGFEVELDQDAQGGEWTCRCTMTMVPDHWAISDMEKKLDALAGPFGGRADGWGGFPVR